MPRHKFRVGQAVEFRPGRLCFHAPTGESKIIKLLPSDGIDLLYRIRCVGETFERVAKERELAPRGLTY
jgi:hypothetical protein